MASNSTVSFDEYIPDSSKFAAPRAPSNFSAYYGCPPLGIRVRINGMLVKGVYGDGRKQSELREMYLQQVADGDINDKLLTYARPICPEQGAVLREWEATWREAAAQHIKDSTVGKRGSKLVYSSMFRDDSAFKFNVPHDVVEQCRSEVDAGDVFDLGHGVFDLVFRVSGIWRNAQNYGYTLSALRMSRVKLIANNKRKAPGEFETVASKWDFDADSVDDIASCST